MIGLFWMAKIYMGCLETGFWAINGRIFAWGECHDHGILPIKLGDETDENIKQMGFDHHVMVVFHMGIWGGNIRGNRDVLIWLEIGHETNRNGGFYHQERRFHTWPQCDVTGMMGFQVGELFDSARDLGVSIDKSLWLFSEPWVQFTDIIISA